MLSRSELVELVTELTAYIGAEGTLRVRNDGYERLRELWGQFMDEEDHFMSESRRRRTAARSEPLDVCGECGTTVGA